LGLELAKNNALTGNSESSATGLDGEKLQNGLAKLVLVVVKLLLEVVERQAYRRVMDGTLDDQEVERLGSALMQARKKFEETATQFGFGSDELDLNLGSTHAGARGSNALGLATSSLVDVIDALVEKGTTIAGEINVSVAGIDLIVLDLLATLQPVRKTLKKPKAAARTKKRGPRKA